MYLMNGKTNYITQTLSAEQLMGNGVWGIRPVRRHCWAEIIPASLLHHCSLQDKSLLHLVFIHF